MTVVSPDIIRRMRLPNVDTMTVVRAGRSFSVHQVYHVGLDFYSETENDDASTPATYDVKAVEIEPASPGVDVIIGRDLLVKMTLHWNGPAGKAWIGF